MSTNNPESRITLESLDEKNTIPVLEWNSRNFWFILGSGATAYVLGQELGFGLGVVAPMIALAMYLGFDLVRSTPPYCDVVQWLRSIVEYHRQPDKFANTAEAHVETDSSLRAAVQTPESTRELTHVERFYPPHGVVERTDGSKYAVLRFRAPNMDFATEEQFVDLMNMVSGWYNSNIDFDVSLYVTTRPVDMEEYFVNLAERVDDPDVQQNEIFRALLEEMKEDRRQMLERSNTEIVHFYFIVDVEEEEVVDAVGGDDDARDRSWVFKFLTSPDESANTDDSVTDARMEKLLDKRINTIQELMHGGSVVSDDAEINRVTASEAAAILGSYWTGRSISLDPDDRDPIPMNKLSRGPLTRDEVETPDSPAEVAQ